MPSDVPVRDYTRQLSAAFPEALERLTGDWRDERTPRLACGMIGSRQGWREAPYLPCPASLDALSRGLVDTDGGELAIVPGLSTRDASGVPDVMRGEETQILGAVPADAGCRGAHQRPPRALSSHCLVAGSSSWAM